MNSGEASGLEGLPAEIMRMVALELHPRDFATLLCCSHSLRTSFDGLADISFASRHLRRHYRFIPQIADMHGDGDMMDSSDIRKLRRLPFMHLPIEYAVAFIATLGEEKSFSWIVTPLGLPARGLVRRGEWMGLAPREQLPPEFVGWLKGTVIKALERGLIPLAERPALWVYYFSAWLDSPDLFRFATARLLSGQEVDWSRVDETASVLDDDDSVVVENDEYLNLSYFVTGTLIDAIGEGAESLVRLLMHHRHVAKDGLIAFTHTPLTAACEASPRGGVGLLPLLLEAGFDVNAEDGYRRTALLRARSVAQVELLLRSGADPLVKDGEGFNALHLCMDSGLGVEAVEMVLERAAEVADKRAFREFVNAQGKRERKTPLMNAVLTCPAVVQLLLESNAHLLRRDRRGRTAMDYLFTRRCKWLREKRFEVARVLFRRLAEAPTTFPRWYIEGFIEECFRRRELKLLEVMRGFEELRGMFEGFVEEEEFDPESSTSDEDVFSLNGLGLSDSEDEGDGSDGDGASDEEQ
ncbi:hypothetical protein HDU96_004467 [Phlyctochytrium bullatum]|nr:hypothetical protein HDU96_004467 [Phlyctochytrium bullatum]